MVRRIAFSLLASTGCYSGAGATDDDAPEGGETLGGSADDDDGSEDGADEDSGAEEPSEGDFGRVQLRRLTQHQFSRSVRDLLGETVVVNPDLDPDLVADLFTTIGATKVTSSSRGIERYEIAALEAAQQVFATPDARLAFVGCDVAQDDACAAGFLARFGRRAWRRPLTDEELDRWLGIVAAAPGAEGDRWLGLQLAVAGILQSPSFIYLVEVGEPDPEAPGRWRYTDWEMAGRLAAFLWASAPDDALLDAAAAGELTAADGLHAQVERMLADPRASTALPRFFTELLHLDVAENIAKDSTVFPEASPQLFAAMRTEVERIVERIAFEDDGDLRELFVTRETFVDAALADLYGLPAPDPALVDDAGFAPATIPDDWARVGFLGAGVFLASNGTLIRTSPTLRGLFVQRRLPGRSMPRSRERSNGSIAAAAACSSMPAMAMGLQPFMSPTIAVLRVGAVSSGGSESARSPVRAVMATSQWLTSTSPAGD
jgi:hypothetical protein